MDPRTSQPTPSSRWPTCAAGAGDRGGGNGGKGAGAGGRHSTERQCARCCATRSSQPPAGVRCWSGTGGGREGREVCRRLQHGGGGACNSELGDPSRWGSTIAALLLPLLPAHLEILLIRPAQERAAIRARLARLQRAFLPLVWRDRCGDHKAGLGQGLVVVVVVGCGWGRGGGGGGVLTQGTLQRAEPPRRPSNAASRHSGAAVCQQPSTPWHLSRPFPDTARLRTPTAPLASPQRKAGRRCCAVCWQRRGRRLCRRCTLPPWR